MRPSLNNARGISLRATFTAEAFILEPNFVVVSVRLNLDKICSKVKF